MRRNVVTAVNVFVSYCNHFRSGRPGCRQGPSCVARPRDADCAATNCFVAHSMVSMSLLSTLERTAVHEPSAASAFLGSFIGLGGLVVGEAALKGSSLVALWPGFHPMVFAASFGALSTLLFAAPAAPLGRIRNTLLGHAIAIMVALFVHHGLSRLVPVPADLEKVLTPSLAIAAMLQAGATHPPAAASVILYTLLDDARQQGPIFMLLPALVGSLYMLGVQQFIAYGVRMVKTWSSRSEEGNGKGSEPSKSMLPSGRGWLNTRDIVASGVLDDGTLNGRGKAPHRPSLAELALTLKPSLSALQIKQQVAPERLREVLGEAVNSDADDLDDLRAARPGLSTEELRRELLLQQAKQRGADPQGGHHELL